MFSHEKEVKVLLLTWRVCFQGRSQYEANRGNCLGHFFFPGKVRFFEEERKKLAANKFRNSEINKKC